MKRVLIIGMSDTLGGVETYIYNLIKYIRKDIFLFDFLVIGEESPSVFEKEINSLLKGNHFYYSPNLKKDYKNAKKWLKSFFKNHTYDVIYMNTCTAARITYCLDGLKHGNTTLITHSHNGRADNWKGRINNSLFRPFTTNKSKVRLACSDVAYHYLFSDSPKGEWFIPNGVDVERFKFNLDKRNEIREKFNFSNNDFLIGCVGRFSEQKNHQYLIQIAKKIDSRFKFILIGDGELKDKFCNDIKRESIENRFILLKAINDIQDYYNAFDLFLMPSIFEGLPITAVEAQCNGLPCIFSTNITKQVALSDNCKFIDLKDIEMWIETINKFKISRYDGKRVIIEKNFDILSTVKKIENLLINL